MSNTIFNTKPVNPASQPMFFGEELGLARYDLMKYPQFQKSDDTQMSLYWNPEEIHLEKDRTDFYEMDAASRWIWSSNIGYQIVVDSIQERATLRALLPWISLPELEACVITWAFFEKIHSRSYQHILKNVVNDPTELFDNILKQPEILARAASGIKYYDEFIEYSDLYRALGPGRHTLHSTAIEAGNDVEHLERVVTLSMKELKRRLYRAIVSIFTLEGIRFYVSFACSFAFGQQGRMIKAADIVKLIAKDEAQHMGIAVNIIRNWKKDGDAEMLEVIAEEEATVLKIFDDTVDDEKAFAKFLFSKGAVLGLNEKFFCQYVESIANKRLKAIGFTKRYESTEDPFKDWMHDWLSAEATQAAPQEKEITDYLVNVLDTNVNDDNLLDL